MVNACFRRWLLAVASSLGAAMTAPADLTAAEPPSKSPWPNGFQWTASGPLLAPAKRDDRCYSVKDPTIVRHADRWHLFCTIRSEKRTHQIEYLSFADWDRANQAQRHILTLSDGYFCAPQVFYLSLLKKWCLVCQAGHPGGKPEIVPAVSFNDDISRPTGWTKPTPLFADRPAHVPRWIDFWVIADEGVAHLFFTGNDGTMWRCQTKLAEFPAGWSKPEIAIKGDIFEASHTYRLRGERRFLTVIEAQRGVRRYYKAYLADSLAGEWRPVADSYDKPFAALGNVLDDPAGGGHWADSISHGELLRAGADETMEIDPADLRFLFQGATDAEMQGKPYGQIPWRLGLLRPRSAEGPAGRPRSQAVSHDDAQQLRQRR